MNYIKDKLQAFQNKISSMKGLRIIQKTLALVLPITLIGSVFSLLTGFPYEPWKNFIVSNGLNDVFQLVYDCTYGHYSLYLAFATAYQYCLANGQKKNAPIAGLLAICAFMISCPIGGISNYIGTTGVLGSMVVGYVTAWLFKSLIDKNMTIKLPEGVPPMVSQAFVSMIPAFVVMVVFMTLNFAISKTSFVSAQDLIYSIISMPLSAVAGNGFGELLMVVYCSALWFFGIHGGMIMMPIIQVVFMDKMMSNLAAYTAGTELPNMFIGTSILGEGFAVSIAIILFSRRKEIKEIAKIGFIPYIFNISEPTNFGIPIIMNPNFFIPFLMTPFIGFACTHLAQLIGFLPFSNGVQVAWTLPVTVQAFFQYGWQGSVVSIIVTVINFLIFIPFVKKNDTALDKQDSLELSGN